MNRKRILVLSLLLLALIIVIIVITTGGNNDQESSRSSGPSQPVGINPNEGGKGFLGGNRTGESGNNVFPTEADRREEDADSVRAYYEENGKIISIVEAKQSRDVLSESEAVTAFEKRGFSHAVQYNYTMDGEYLDSMDAGQSPDKHPMYESWYVAGEKDVWFLYCINGSFIAFPAFYGSEEGAAVVPILFTESDSIWGYDGAGNRFYLTQPNGKEAVLIRIAAINAETLDGLTKEVIDSLCAQQ